MKHLLLAIYLLLTISIQSNGQGCTPSWPNGKGPGVIPDSATNLPHAVEGMPYEASIQFKVLTDTTYLGFHAYVDWVKITSVTGLSSIPNTVGFVYTPNPATGKFLGGQLGCVDITGTPSLESASTYPITVGLTIYFHFSGGSAGSYNLPTTVTFYKIVVDGNTGVPTVDMNKFDMTQNYPNPVKSTTSISFNVPTRTLADFQVYNLIGNVLYKKTIDAKPGVNTIIFDASDIEPGVYFYNISSGSAVLTKRLVVDKR